MKRVGGFVVSLGLSLGLIGAYLMLGAPSALSTPLPQGAAPAVKGVIQPVDGPLCGFPASMEHAKDCWT
jgi:hypothetical protein